MTIGPAKTARFEAPRRYWLLRLGERQMAALRIDGDAVARLEFPFQDFPRQRIFELLHSVEGDLKPQPEERPASAGMDGTSEPRETQ